MIHELRIYRCLPNKLPALIKRFEKDTLAQFAKHGIRQAGFWTVLVGPNQNTDLYYLLEWESMAEREQKWNAFAADKEWAAIREASEKDGAIVGSVDVFFLKPTAFSSVK